jgi:replicative DNA helicase
MMSVVETPLMSQALDAEEALLGSILIDPDALLAARSLKPDAFYRDAHATLFATMRQLEDDGIAVDSVTVLTRLERTGQLARAGGSSYVLGLVNAVPTSMNAHYYAHLVQKAAEGRKVIEVGGAIASIGYHSSDPAKAALRAVETLAAAHEEADGLDLTPEEARARLEELAPPLYHLDELMAHTFSDTKWVVPDLLPEGLTLLAAKPKLGKSWMALGLALAVASGGLALGEAQVQQGDVLYLALEDSPKRLHKRAEQLLRDQPAPHALQLGTDWPRLDQGGARLLEVWLKAHPDARLLILDTFAKIRGTARSATLYGDDYASLEQVQRLAHAHSIAILVIHHTTPARRAAKTRWTR